MTTTAWLILLHQLLFQGMFVIKNAALGAALVEDGIYRHSRNPYFVSYLLMFAAYTQYKSRVPRYLFI